MASLVQSLPITIQNSSSRKSSGQANPERSLLHSLDSFEGNVVAINENTTKQQLMRQRDRVFLNNSNPHNPTSQLLIKFMMEKKLVFTGTDLRFYEITRDEAMIAAASSGMMIPDSNHVFQVSQIANFEEKLPIMVKPDWQINCNNRTQQNYVVDNMEALRIMTQTMIEECGGANLEQYIPGREIACLCYSSGDDIITLNPVEFSFKPNGPQFITQQLKNDPLRQQWYELCQDEDLVKQVKKNIESFFKILSLSGEFLFTLRINEDQMFLINYKPINFPLQGGVRPFKTSSLLESILYHNHLGKKNFLDIMIEAANMRQTKREKNYAIRYNMKKNLPVLYATRDIEPQETVYEQENARNSIVVIDWLKNHFQTIEWGNFWTRKSQHWKPISHSCSPNSIVTLNSVQAIKRISQGEEITIDFTTLFYHNLTFQCSCESPNCRKVIEFKNQKEEWFLEIPSSHLHPWMMDFMFKQTLINLINAKNPNVKLQYEPGNCFAVAKRNISKGERVVQLDDLPIHNYNTRHSITKNQLEYWDTTTSYGQYLNHKCHNYNLKLNEDDTAMVAVTDIPEDRLLTFNYLTTEPNVCFPFTCLCGEEKCYRVIRGFRNHPKSVQEQIYKIGHCSQFVKSIYQQQ